MSKQTILITTQYKENYGAHSWNGEGQCPQAWKPKGGHTFQIEMDADLLLYSDAKAIFSKMLKAQSNDHESFEFIEYEIQWQQPTVLGVEEDFISVMQELQHCS